LQIAKDLRNRVDLYLEPAVGHYDLFDWGALEAIAETGYRETRLAIEAWGSEQAFPFTDPTRV
jgi:hypothetical protein